MVITEITHELKLELPYATPTAGAVDGSFVTMRAPSVRHLKYTAPLRQIFTRAIIEAQSKNSGKENSDEQIDSSETVEAAAQSAVEGSEDEENAETVAQVLDASSEDIGAFVTKFSKFIIDSGLFLIDGEIKFNESLLDKMCTEDFYSLMGKYLSNFIVASLLK